MKGPGETPEGNSSCNMDAVYARYLLIKSRGVDLAYVRVAAEIFAGMAACREQCLANKVEASHPVSRDQGLRAFGRGIFSEWVVNLFS